MKAAAEQTKDRELSEKAEDGYQQLKKEASEYSQKMQRQLVDNWSDDKMQPKARMTYREKTKTGTVFIKSVFDFESRKIKNEICDLTTIYPSPNISTIEKHTTEPFIYAPILSLGEVEKQYGINANEIEEGAIGTVSSRLPSSTKITRSTTP